MPPAKARVTKRDRSPTPPEPELSESEVTESDGSQGTCEDDSDRTDVEEEEGEEDDDFEGDESSGRDSCDEEDEDTMVFVDRQLAKVGAPIPPLSAPQTSNAPTVAPMQVKMKNAVRPPIAPAALVPAAERRKKTPLTTEEKIAKIKIYANADLQLPTKAATGQSEHTVCSELIVTTDDITTKAKNKKQSAIVIKTITITEAGEHKITELTRELAKQKALVDQLSLANAELRAEIEALTTPVVSATQPVDPSPQRTKLQALEADLQKYIDDKASGVTPLNKQTYIDNCSRRRLKVMNEKIRLEKVAAIANSQVKELLESPPQIVITPWHSGSHRPPEVVDWAVRLYKAHSKTMQAGKVQGGAEKPPTVQSSTRTASRCGNVEHKLQRREVLFGKLFYERCVQVVALKGGQISY